MKTAALKPEMEWNKEKTLLLIREFHSRPGLWNMTHEDYRKREVKKTLLEEIAKKFDNCVTAAGIEKKFHTLRTQYHREISRMNTNRGAEPYKSKWFAYPHLSFLNDPSACRNAKDPRRRPPPNPPTTKLVFISPSAKNEDVEMTTSTPVSSNAATATAPNTTLQELQVTVSADKETAPNTVTKNLRVLFENVEQEDTKVAVEQNSIAYLHSETRLHDNINTAYEEEHLVDENNDEMEQDEEYQQIEPTTTTPLKLLKTEHHNHAVRRQNHEIYQEIVYEATGSHQNLTPPPPPLPPPAKRACKEDTVVAPSVFLNRDEFSTYGEFIANELRYITDRQILISVKHKINTALFEASVAQLEKSS